MSASAALAITRRSPYIEQKQKDKSDLVYETVIYRRDKEEKLLIMFLKPKSGGGQRVLEARMRTCSSTTRASASGSAARTARASAAPARSVVTSTPPRSPLDYDPSYVGADELGAFEVHHLELNAKEGAEVAYPKLHIWVDAATGSVLKVQEFALSDKLMRTSYYPKWSKVKNDEKGTEVYFPQRDPDLR